MISCMPVFCFYKASEWRCSAFQIVAAWHGGFSCNFTEATGSGSITCRAEQCREEQGRYTWLLININVDWFIDRRRLGVGVQTYRLYNRSSSFGRRSTRIRKRDHWTILEHICTRWHRIFLFNHVLPKHVWALYSSNVTCAFSGFRESFVRYEKREKSIDS